MEKERLQKIWAEPWNATKNDILELCAELAELQNEKESIVGSSVAGKIKFQLTCSCGKKIDGYFSDTDTVERLHCDCGVVWEVKRPVQEESEESSDSEPTLLKCPFCQERNQTVYVDAGGLVVHEGQVHLLQVLPEPEGDTFLPFEEAGIGLNRAAECSECRKVASVQDFLVK